MRKNTVIATITAVCLVIVFSLLILRDHNKREAVLAEPDSIAAHGQVVLAEPTPMFGYDSSITVTASEIDQLYFLPSAAERRHVEIIEALENIAIQIQMLNDNIQEMNDYIVPMRTHDRQNKDN